MKTHFTGSPFGGTDGFNSESIRNQLRPACIQREIIAQYGDVAVTVWHPLRVTVTSKEEALKTRVYSLSQHFGQRFLIHYCGLRADQVEPCSRQYGPQQQWVDEICYMDGMGKGFMAADGRTVAAIFRSIAAKYSVDFRIVLYSIVYSILFSSIKTIELT